MAALSSILQERVKPRNNTVNETGLEKGQIWIYTPGTQSTNYATCCFCWYAPGNGTAVVEIWGAAGSGARGRCCHQGVPGNPGAYAKKTVQVTTGNFVRGVVGMSCPQSGEDHFRGCSQATCISICSIAGCNCLCAQGGIGGTTYCIVSSYPAVCCFECMGFCTSGIVQGANNCYVPGSNGRCCGVICNLHPKMNTAPARAYGGDINKAGGISCTTVLGAEGIGGSVCCVFHHVRTSPGIVSEEGTFLTFNLECSSPQVCIQGQTLSYTLQGLGLAGHQPSRGAMYSIGYHPGPCSRICGCWDFHACQPFLPPGVPGSSTPSPDVFDMGTRGGMGLVRIKFIGS